MTGAGRTTSRTWRLTKKLKRKHKSRGTNCLLDVRKDSVPSESHLETATLTPGANPLLPKSHSLHPPGLWPFPEPTKRACRERRRGTPCVGGKALEASSPARKPSFHSHSSRIGLPQTSTSCAGQKRVRPPGTSEWHRGEGETQDPSLLGGHGAHTSISFFLGDSVACCGLSLSDLFPLQRSYPSMSKNLPVPMASEPEVLKSPLVT